MGFRISWVAFRDVTRAEVLDLVGGLDTGIPDDANEEPLSIAEIPGGWIILFSNDFGFISEERLQALSKNGLVVACQLHEGVMFSAVFSYERGQETWAVAHDAQEGIRNLLIAGEPPPPFEQIRERLSKEQDDNGGDDAEVDCYFDIPVETAQAICGYRHDLWKFDWGEPSFSVVDVAAHPG